ncbi:hypothetical protein FUSPEROL_02078 [Fusobacterium periodonticum ATCC 33693]|uniref:Uncharacterized protein n=2 Tax=Fusobacterium periodonticum TaxID=860 RepID=D4CXB7_9FUSO|nr:hypothetical protein FUSPEROL_02078 [Fusobacterium periodonticum ATCC 33693]
MIKMLDWELFEKILKKPLQEIIDLTTGDWKKGICKDKKKFFDKEALLRALREKINGKN